MERSRPPVRKGLCISLRLIQIPLNDFQSRRFANLGREVSNLTATPAPILPSSSRSTLAEYNIQVSFSIGSLIATNTLDPSRGGFWRYAKAPLDLRSRRVATSSNAATLGSPTTI